MRTMLTAIFALMISGNAAAREIRDGVELELTAPGMQVLADVLTKELGGSLSDIGVPDVHDTLPMGVEATLSGVRASLAIDGLSLVPSAEGLRLTVALKDVRVTVDSMRLERDVFGANIGTTCESTVLHLAENGVVTFDGRLAASVVEDQIRLVTHDLSMPVDYGDYRAVGPEACSGLWGVRDVTRLVLSGVLKVLWPFVERLVTDRIAAIVPTIEEQLNLQTHISLMFQLRNLPPLDDRTAELELFPARLDLDDSAMRIVAGFRLRVVEAEARITSTQPDAEAIVRLASFGINPSLVTEAFAELYPNGTRSIELDAATLPALGDLLKVRAMAAVWPDLNEAPVTSSKLRLFARVLAPPHLGVDESRQTIRAQIPRLEMRFQAQIAGEWQDYFIVELDFDAGVRATSSSGELRLALLDDYAVTIRGQWAPGYAPAVDLFEEDLLGVLVATAFDYLKASGPLAKMALPSFPLDGRTMTLGSPSVRGAFVRLDVLSD